MNKDIEKKFISDFILKEYAERLFFELSGKKRQKALARFAHAAEQIFDMRYLLKLNSADNPEMLLQNIGVEASCPTYVIGGGYDGRTIPLNKVLTNVFNGCDAVVAVVKDGLAICKSEYEKGESGKYILKK